MSPFPVAGFGDIAGNMAGFFKRANESTKTALGHLRAAFHPSKPWVARTRELGRSRRVRKIGVIVVAVVLFLGVATYIAVPPVLRHVLTGSVASSIHRQVSVGKIRFNLYRLKLDLDQLHVGERDDPQKPFVDLGHLAVKVSWTSLFRLAPVVGEVVIDKPAIHVVRLSQQKFNFSDLLESAPAPAKPKPVAPSSPQRFAVSNIQLRDGEVTIDDQLLGKQHKVEKIQINVPFIANLPADVDVFVQPLVQMVIDGSPLRIAGVAKPFQATRDSVVDLKLHRLDLPLYVSYAPMKLPVKIPSGTLSTDLYLHFVQAESQPLIRLNGTVALDQLDVRDTADAPLVALKHAEVKLTDVEPLGAVFYLRSIWIDGLLANVRLNPDGTNNLSSLASGSAAPAASPPAQVAAASTPMAAPTSGGQCDAAGSARSRSVDGESADGFSVGIVRSHEERCEHPGQQRCDSGDGGARCARGGSKESSDAREVAGDVLREHQYSQRRRAGGERARWISRNRRLRATCRSTRSICLRLQPFAQKIPGGYRGVGQIQREGQRADAFRERSLQRALGAGERRDRKFRGRRAARKRKAGAVEKFQRRDRAVRSGVASGDGYRSESRRDASVCPARARREIESRISDARQRSSATHRARGGAPAEANAARAPTSASGNL